MGPSFTTRHSLNDIHTFDHMTPISLKLAWRETASSWSRFFFLFLCIALGVGAIVAVDLFATNVEQVILGDARGLLGGDIELSWRRAMSKNGQEVLDSLSERKIILSHITELAAMAAVESSQLADQTTKATSQLVELKALDSFYPLYGSLMVEPAQATEQLLAPIHSGCQRLPCFGAIAQKSLLIRLDLGLGSELRIGHTNFLITGILVKEPDKIVAARLGNAGGVVIGIGDGEMFIASDIPAILEHTREVVFIEPSQMAIIERDGYKVQTIDGAQLEPAIHHIAWDSVAAEKGEYKHFMLKEIYEQVRSVTNTIGGRVDFDQSQIR